MIRAIVSDFGGVVTRPLSDAFKRAHEDLDVPLDALAQAMRLLAERHPEPPLWTLERGQISEGEFMSLLAGAVSEIVERPVELDGYGRRLMGSLEANQPLLDRYRHLRDEHGLRLAILTNNVREWHDAWRTKLAIDDLFELVVDSAFEGVRKPEREIYTRTLDRLGLTAGECVFIDDLEVNLPPARELGMHTIHFCGTDQTIARLTALLM